MSAQKFGFGPRKKSRPQLATASSLSLRWRVMLLAMSMVAMVVVLMAVAVYAVVSRALYDDIDNQLHSRARLLIESGSLAADPGKAIEGTAYSDVNAMLVNPGRSIYTANQEGQTLPLGESGSSRSAARSPSLPRRRKRSAARTPTARSTRASSASPRSWRRRKSTACRCAATSRP